MRRIPTLALILCLMASVSTGCASDDEPEATTTTAATGGGPTTVAPIIDSVPQAAVPSLPRPQTLDRQVNHPNGTVLRVTELTFFDDHMQVHVVVTNGNTRAVELNRFGRTLLRDERGVVYRVSTPPENPDLEVQPGGKLDGNLVFLGRINPEAQRLTLVVNDGFDNGSEHTVGPTMVVADLPVQR